MPDSSLGFLQSRHRSGTRHPLPQLVVTRLHGTRPWVGLSVGMPQKWAGTRRLPPESLPRPSGEAPAATPEKGERLLEAQSARVAEVLGNKALWLIPASERWR